MIGVLKHKEFSSTLSGGSAATCLQSFYRFLGVRSFLSISNEPFLIRFSGLVRETKQPLIVLQFLAIFSCRQLDLFGQVSS